MFTLKMYMFGSCVQLIHANHTIFKSKLTFTIKNVRFENIVWLYQLKITNLIRCINYMVYPKT